MPSVTLPNTWISGDTPTADDVMENLCHPNSTPDSMDVINGFLDENNLKTGHEIEYEHLQPGAASLSGSVGATATLDLFHTLFDTDTVPAGTGTTDTEADFVPVPGATQTFYLPRQAQTLILFWNISFITDGDDAGTPGSQAHAAMRLFVDGTTYSDQRRVARSTVIDTGSSAWDYRGDFCQHWSGHMVLTDVAAGWHTVGLRAVSEALQLRIRNRAFSFVAL